MSAGEIDFKTEIIEHVNYCQPKFGDKMKVEAAEVGASLARAKAVGNTKLTVKNIPRGHDLIKSGRLLRTIEDAAMAANPRLVFGLEFA